MVMTLKKAVYNLEQLESKSTKENYRGDATEYAFRRHCLLLLDDLKKQLKENSKQYKYLWQTLEECDAVHATDDEPGNITGKAIQERRGI